MRSCHWWCWPVFFGVVAYLTNGRMRQLTQDRETLSQQLAEANLELTQTTNDLEARVERRTFEISVANASLNREIAERMQAEAEDYHNGSSGRWS